MLLSSPTMVNPINNDSNKEGFWSEFIRRLNPSVCISGSCGIQNINNPSIADFCSKVDNTYLVKNIPSILQSIDSATFDGSAESQKALNALHKLYRLTGSGYEFNRVPIVCSLDWNIIATLSKCLTFDVNNATNTAHSDEARLLACQILNNLSIPSQNKAAMVFGGGKSNLLIERLVNIIRLRLPEAYLSCMCLMNLTVLEDAIDSIINFSPLVASNPKSPPPKYPVSQNRTPSLTRRGTPPGSRRSTPLRGRTSIDPSEFNPKASSSKYSPLDDPTSLIRSLESMIQVYSPFLMSKVMSVEGEAVRWAVGLLRNLTKKKKHFELILNTNIPHLLLQLLLNSPHPIIGWTSDSLEDMALTVVYNLIQNENGQQILLGANAIDIFKRIMSSNGRNIKTITILSQLESI